MEDDLMMMDTLTGDMTDTMVGGDMTDTMAGGDMTDTLAGGDMTDTLAGGDMTDTMVGGDMTDTLAGGDEIIDPSEGTDVDPAVTTGVNDEEGGEAGDRIFIGESFGEFTGPVDPDADSVFETSDSNGGTNNRFEWGEPVDSFSNVVQFDGFDFGAKLEESFKIGQLFYRNGTTNNNFNGEFGFELSIDFDDTDNDPDPFVFLFDILNTRNTTGDAVEDGDRLRFASGGLSPETFTLDGQTYTLELIGFSTDGGETTTGGFDSPEESFEIANLYGQILGVPDEISDSFDPLDEVQIDEILDNDGVLLGGDDVTGEGAVAGSVLLNSETDLSIVWSITTKASITLLNRGDDDPDNDDDGTIVGSEGDDDLSGTDDNDVSTGGDGNDEIDGGSGNDVCLGEEGDDMVMGDDDTDVIAGNQGNDMVMGGDGDDVCYGGQDDDMVMGEGGGDVLIGDMGQDSLMGGDGDDDFVCRPDTDVDNTSADMADWIMDFEQGDRIAITLMSEFSIDLQVTDANGDGVDDVAIRANNQFYVGVVLGTSDMDMVQDAIIDVPDPEYLV